MKRLAVTGGRLAIQLAGLILLPLLYLLEPFWKIRFGTMYTQRFGHLAQNHDVFLRLLQRDGHPKRTSYFAFGYDPANRQLFDMLTRTRPFYASRWMTRIMFAWRPIYRKTRFWMQLRFSGNEQRLFNETDPVIAFTPEEIAYGNGKLREMGIGADDWFVCMHARDTSYLREWRPEYADTWDKVDFKNASIESYVKAAEYIAAQGGFVLRYGAVVEKPFPVTDNPRIIDYATKHRSDFMDIFLAAHCRFFLATSSGPCGIPTMFNRPVIIGNHFPYTHTHYRADDLIVPRPVLDNETGEPVPFYEALRNGFYVWDATTQEVSSKGANMQLYRWGENSADDLRDSCADMIASLGNEPVDPAAQRVQEAYRELYLSHLSDPEMGAKIAPSYALRHRDLIVPPQSPLHQAADD